MPLAYSFEAVCPNSAPCPESKCDLLNCNGNGPFCRLHCFHSFHKVCLEKHQKCPICHENLKKKIEDLSTKFNSSLLEPTKSKHKPTEQQIDEDDEVNARPASFYKSEEWQERLYDIFNEIPSVTQPSKNIRQAPQPSPDSSNNNPEHSLHNNPVPRNSNTNNPLQQSNTNNAAQDTNDVTSPMSSQSQPCYRQQTSILYKCISSTHYWFFPHHISQSTINGRNGSTACTLIALLMAHKYNTARPILNMIPTGI